MCPNQHSAAFMCQLHDASSLLAKISLQVGWIGAFQVGLDIRLDWISCDHLRRVKCGDCIKFEAIFQFFDIGYRRVSGNWLMMLFHLKGGGILDLEFQRDVAIWHQQLCFSCFSWTIVNLWCKVIFLIFSSLLLAVSLSNGSPNTLRKCLWLTAVMKFSHPNAKKLALSRASVTS